MKGRARSTHQLLPPFEKGGLRGIFRFQPPKSPLAPLFQRGEILNLMTVNQPVRRIHPTQFIVKIF
jgi:hypothetical protein